VVSKVFIAKAYYRGFIEGAAMAARPLKAEVDGLKAWKKEAQKKIAIGVLKTVLFVGGGVVVGFTVGALAK